MPYRVFLPANVAGGVVWGTAFCLLGYFVGQGYKRVESISGIASDILLGLLVILVVGLVIRGRRREKREVAEAAAESGGTEGRGGSNGVNG